MSWQVRINHEGERVSVAVNTLAAQITLANEQMQHPEMVEYAIHHLRKRVEQLVDEGWQIMEDPVLERTDQFLPNTTVMTMTVKAWRRPGEWTSVDTQINRDTDGAWATDW